MPLTKRATVYLEPLLDKALRATAAATDQTLSELVNDAVRLRLAADAELLAALRARVKPSVRTKRRVAKG